MNTRYVLGVSLKIRLPFRFSVHKDTNLEMAIAARQVRVAAAEDGVIAVQRDVVIDPDTGIAAEVEKVIVAVDMGGGQIAVAEQQRIVGYKVGRQVRVAVTAEGGIHFNIGSQNTRYLM